MISMVMVRGSHFIYISWVRIKTEKTEAGLPSQLLVDSTSLESNDS